MPGASSESNAFRSRYCKDPGDTLGSSRTSVSDRAPRFSVSGREKKSEKRPMWASREMEERDKGVERNSGRKRKAFARLYSRRTRIMLAVFRVFLRGAAAITSTRNKEKAYLLSRTELVATASRRPVED